MRMNSSNRIARVLFIIGILEIIVCCIIGLMIGQPMLTMMWWIGGFVSGMIITGLSEIIKLLQEIRNNTIKVDVEGAINEANDYTIRRYHLTFEKGDHQFDATLSQYGNEFTVKDASGHVIHYFTSVDIIELSYTD